MKINRQFFLLGLLIYYIISFLAPNKPIYFFSYFISTLFFYLSTKNLQTSLLYSLILSLFSEIGFGGSLFLMEPQSLNQGSGWWISPTTLLLLCLLMLSLHKKIKKIHIADVLALIFFFWTTILILFIPNTNVLYGIVSLGELILVYILFRIYLTIDNFELLNKILISMLVFQSIIAAIQFLLQRPIGILSESVLFLNPFGLTTPEESNIFRVTGTFSHPNNFAAVLLSITPFLFLTKFKNKNLRYFFILPVTVIFFTYSRAAWLIFAIIAGLIIIRSNYFQDLGKKFLSLKTIFIVFVLAVGVLIFLQPYISKRMQSVSLALSEFGSWGVRIKLTQEALSIISQYPLTGVGLNRSVEAYVASPVTDIVEVLGNYKYYKIHNTFLEIAAESGIPGFILFSLFLVFVFKHYFQLKNKSNFQKAAFYGLIGLIGMSMFNPFFHSSQFRLFFLLSAVILA